MRRVLMVVAGVMLAAMVAAPAGLGCKGDTLLASIEDGDTPSEGPTEGTDFFRPDTGRDDADGVPDVPPDGPGPDADADVPDGTRDDADVGPDVPPDGPGPDADADADADADGHDAFPETEGHDTWVPDSWDVPFEYLDIGPDYTPDAAGCGNGVVDPGEECDDGNSNDHDECTNHCLFPRCGDGSVWFGMEDCDPPGSARPCLTSCGTGGGEQCNSYCQWTGVCVPPTEVCGNGIDDDCDGVTDLIVRNTGNIKFSDRPTGESGGEPALVWTGHEFAIAWRAYPGVSVLTRLDEWGSRVSADRDLTEVGPRWGDGIFWTGSYLDFLWDTGTTGATHYELLFHAADSTGVPVSSTLTLRAETECCGGVQAAAYPGGLAIVRMQYSMSPSQAAYLTMSADGATVGPDVLLGFEQTPCFTWTGSDFAMGYMGGASGTEQEIAFISTDGIVTARTNIPTFTGSYIYACAAAGSRMQLLVDTSRPGGAPLRLLTVGRDGSLVREEIIAAGTPPPLPETQTAIVWNGSELGIVWSDRRVGNLELYFARADADGVKLGGDARLTHTATPSGYPSLAWSGTSWGAVWNDSDGVDVGTYFADFSTCP